MNEMLPLLLTISIPAYELPTRTIVQITSENVILLRITDPYVQLLVLSAKAYHFPVTFRHSLRENIINLNGR